MKNNRKLSRDIFQKPARFYSLIALVVACIAMANYYTTGAATQYEAEIRRTSHGIPHITAKNMGSLGFGEGYAFAQDHLCSMADQVVKVRGERARFFGPGERETHLNNDISFKALGIYEQAGKLYQSMPAEIREMIDGYTAGYNKYLKETGVNSVAGWCKGKEWVFEITPIDVLAYHQAVTVTSTGFADMIATAAPPKSEVSRVNGFEMGDYEGESNGWAIGSERSEGGRGMLVANPHYPWVGSSRFWEKHLTIPGKLNVYGVGLLGSPGVSIGFNEAVAWTHTVSAGKRYTLYSLDLVPGNPTKYLYDGKEREMTSKVVSVDVRQTDGTLKRVERRIFFSHYGPILNMAGLEWNSKRAITFRDANANNMLFQEQRIAMNKARSLEEFKQAHARYNSLPWVNTIATSADGRAWYADTSSTPNLKKEAIAGLLKRKESDPATKTAWNRGIILLDGSNSINEWVDDRETRAGVIPYSRMPQIERRDFVFNANDSFWLANPHQLLTGFSPLQGLEGTSRSLRSRMNVVLLDDLRPDGPSGRDGKFSLDELTAAIFSNRSMSAELLRGQVVKRCQAAGTIMVDNQKVDLNEACRILNQWNGLYELSSVGPVLWREFISNYDPADLQRAGSLFKTDFSPENPIGTPFDLADPKDGKDQALINLGKAVLVLKAANISLDTPLGKVQYSDKNGGRIPIHGGEGSYEGVANFVNYAPNTTTLEPQTMPQRVKGSRFLTSQGYPVNRGSSFVMALEYTPKGPRAKAVLTYSQSGDPSSKLFYDQTELFSAKNWRSILFTTAEINSDPNLKVIKISGKR
jgi:acyl-homoserine-lactone acylase